MEKLFIWLYLNYFTVFKVILAFGAIIFAHELGHFIMAKKVGVRVLEFALGMGPKIFKLKRNETEYSLRIFPVGGFVKLEGEDTPLSNLNDPENFQNKTPLEKIIVIAGGCLMNYIMALILFWTVGIFFGVVSSSTTEITNRISQIIEGTPAARAGLQTGDIILAINNKFVKNGKELIEIIHNNPNKTLKILIQRRSEKFEIKIIPLKDPKTKEGRIGFVPELVIVDFVFEKKGIIEALKFGIIKTYEFTVAPLRVIEMLISGDIPIRTIGESSSGPIGIGHMTFILAKKGIGHLLFFIAILNVAIGFFNLIPFPALDGSRILFLGIEIIRRKPIDQRKEGLIHWIGLIILLTIVVLVTFQDILRIVQGKNFFK